MADFKAGDLVTWANPTMTALMGRQDVGTKAIIKEVTNDTTTDLGKDRAVIVLWLDGNRAMKPIKMSAEHLAHFTNA